MSTYTSRLDNIDALQKLLHSEAHALYREQQAAIGCQARCQIILQILESILDGETEFTGTDQEYWVPIHDKALAKMKELE